jgi:hypothetical protein
MNIFSTFFINLRKLKIKTKNAMFLILPISILVLLSVVITSQIQNIREASSVSVFDTVSDQSRLLQLQKTVAQPSGGGFNMMEMMSSEDNSFDEGDLYTILGVDGVENAQINSSLPITNISTTDLFDGTEVEFSTIYGLDEEFSSLYTSEDFTYTEGEAIPIILNASAFVENYEEWGDQTEYTIDFRSLRGKRPGEEGTEETETVDEETVKSPIKTKAIDYDKDTLIGQTFTINFGGLDDIEDYVTERSEGSSIMRKLSDEEYQALVDARKTSISEYWDYDKVSTPLTYTFVVVGVIEDDSSSESYIPVDFVDDLMSAYVQNQIDAKVVDTISTDVLNVYFTGLTYDGLTLESSTNTMMMAGMRGGFGGEMGGMGARPGESTETESEAIERYNIPGLVIEVADDDSGDVVGEYLNADVYTEATLTGTTINVLLANADNRLSVIEELNELGYAYQDMNNLDVFVELESTLDKVSTGFLIAFIVLIVSLIMITVSRFVSDSKKEIGIFRAMGVTKPGIIKLFLSQSLIYAFVGLAVGLGLGFVMNLAASGIVNNWFTGFIDETMAESFNVVLEADAAIFRNTDWQSIGAYSLILAGITLFTSLIPAYKASSISPVEAIRAE